MQQVFQSVCVSGQCHAMTMVWLAKSMEGFTGNFFAGENLAVYQDAYQANVHLGTASVEEHDEDERLSLEMFDFIVNPVDLSYGQGHASSFAPLHKLSCMRGHGYFSFQGLTKAHAVGVRVIDGCWDMFDASYGLFRSTSASKFRQDVSVHLMTKHAEEVRDSWVVAAPVTRRVSWAHTRQNLLE
jgi:hypothetical protein